MANEDGYGPNGPHGASAARELPDTADTAVKGNMPSRKAEPLPELPYPRMPLSQRAKIFIPFDPLKGFQEALREKEREAEKGT